MGNLLYYLAWFLLSYVAADPRLLFGFVALFLLHRWLPDPVVWLRSFRNVRRLRAEVSVNRANVTARRDLARILLERGRAREALTVLDEALLRQSSDAELHFLRGRALLRLRRYDDALLALGRALELDPSIAQGDPYLLAGDAHRAAGRLAEAEEAYEHARTENHSNLDAPAKLAAVHSARGDSGAARRVRDEAIRTYAELPGYLRRKQLGTYLRLRLGTLFG